LRSRVVQVMPGGNPFSSFPAQAAPATTWISRQAPGQHLRYAAAQPQPGRRGRALDHQLGQHRYRHRTVDHRQPDDDGRDHPVAAVLRLRTPGRAGPSWNQPAARTFFPRRPNSASSIAAVTGCPAGPAAPQHGPEATRTAARRPARPGRLPACPPCPHRRRPRQPHPSWVTFARLHGAELVATGR
jgi:hypothetical protein